MATVNEDQKKNAYVAWQYSKYKRGSNIIKNKENNIYCNIYKNSHHIMWEMIAAQFQLAAS